MFIYNAIQVDGLHCNGYGGLRARTPYYTYRDFVAS